jgi:ribonucleoside-diphosphate reductase alpha chain
MSAIKKIQKRDGRIVDFDQEKITEAIWKAAQNVGGKNRKLAEKISKQVSSLLEVFFKDETKIPTVEQIQDLVEKILIEDGHAKTAKAFILYREKHAEIRQQKTDILGSTKSTKFSVNALKVLNERYLLKDDNGRVKETPEELFERVAKNIAQAEKKFKGDVTKRTKEFYDVMVEKDFLPNSPTLMNAGTRVQQLAACFVLPIEDSIEAIFETLKQSAVIQQTGGGTGFNYSHLRPRTDIVTSTKGSSSGPVSFMKVFNSLTEAMKEGGKRRGANMGILEITHPDILEFIACKEKKGELENFNISVGLTEAFMQAVVHDREYELINPRNGETVNHLSARGVFELLVSKAWSSGEPGIIFLDRIENANPTPKAGKLEATNPCGEQPLLPFEACNLGSINISNFIKNGEIDYPRFKKVIHTAVRFLDDVIEMSDYKLAETQKIVSANRKIGLGIMGFADLLFQLNIGYNTDTAVNLAEKISAFLQKEARAASEKLGEERGSFPNFKESIFADSDYKTMRNATVTTIAPAGSISMIADCSSGIEPLFGLVYTKHVLDGSELIYSNKHFEETLKHNSLYSNELMRLISQVGSIQSLKELPADIKSVFVVTDDISPIWHVRMQAAFQKNTDNAVSKTINLPASASLEDVKQAFQAAYSLGCKGITIYRDSSRDRQVLSMGSRLENESKATIKKNVDIQGQLPFNTDTNKVKKQVKKVEEIAPPPINQLHKL